MIIEFCVNIKELYCLKCKRDTIHRIFENSQGQCGACGAMRETDYVISYLPGQPKK